AGEPPAPREPRWRARGAAPPPAGAPRRNWRADQNRRPQVPARARGLRARPAGLRTRRADPRRSRAALAADGVLHARLASAAMAPAALEATRREWEEGHRRLESAASDRRRYALLLEELELV